MKLRILCLLCCSFIYFSAAAEPFFAWRLEKFVENFEANYDNWNDEKKTRASEKYNEFIKEYKASYDNLSQDEKDRVNNAIGRYNGVLLKSSMQKAGESLKDITDRLPSMIEGFMDAFKKGTGAGE